jgi:hypothetical protein
MERNNLLLPIILIIVIVIVLLLAFSGSNTFQMGQITFDYPEGWSQSSNVGDFNNGTLYSEVVFTSNFANSDGSSQDAYIIIQMQQKTQNSLNIPSTNLLLVNTTNATVGSINMMANFTATQLGNYGPEMAEKVTIIEQGNYYLVITYITPLYAINQTSEAYNQILQTLNVSR